MPKKNKTLCVDDLRHAEYYGMQPVFDELYHRSLEGENFTDLTDLILSRDNILLAYRNIKANGGSYTAGTDNKNISDIGCLPPETVAEKVRFIVTGSQHGYRPKPVRRKDIPKPNGKTRPLGIPCIWDRLVQQCIKQVIEPICEAKFSDNSYGFRPNRSVEHAVQKTYTMLQRMNLHYVIEFDIKGFFDNVNHSKLMRQIWAMGIHDKQLIFIIKRILKAPIRMPDGTTLIPDKGTPQGGIAYIKNKIPMAKKAAVCSYTVEGRALIHTNLSMNSSVLSGLRNQPSMGRSTELTDSRISLFSAQRGKCALSGELFENAADIVCWLKTPAELGGKERYRNMILFHNRFLPLLQECPKNELKEIADTLKATKELMLKVNSLRQQAGLSAIEN